MYEKEIHVTICTLYESRAVEGKRYLASFLPASVTSRAPHYTTLNYDMLENIVNSVRRETTTKIFEPMLRSILNV